MKKSKIVAFATILLAVGSAFVTKASSSKLDNAAFKQSGGLCVSTTTACGSGSRACSESVYSSKLNATTCQNPITLMP